MSDGHRRLADALEIAKYKGCEVVHPKPNELFIDLDSAEQIKNFNVCIAILEKAESFQIIRRETSPSGDPNKQHVVIRMGRDVTDEERILLQACLASDPLREMLSLMRLRRGDEAPTILFEKPKGGRA
jgi:hypothetical protein